MGAFETLVIHCSDSNFGDAKLIDSWHKQRGWKGIGYSLVIPNGYIINSNDYEKEKDGIIQNGRGIDFTNTIEPDEIGAHTLGLNSTSAGICLIGINEFSINQYKTLYYICKTFQQLNPDINIIGHYETEKAHGKTCPNIIMSDWRELLESGAYTLDLDIRSKMVVS